MVPRRPVALICAVVLALVGGACRDDGPSGSGSSRPTALTGPPDGGLPPVPGPFAPGRTQLPGFGEVRVRIVPGPDGVPIVLCVLLAETEDQRARGLMEVTDPDLGGYDGMVFQFPDDVDGGFYMRNTPMPLSIAFVDGDGAVIATEGMEPCPDRDDCPTYPPGRRYRTALEVPRGGLDDLGLVEGGEARVVVGGECAPA